MAVSRESRSVILTARGELPDPVGAVACLGGGGVLPFRGNLSSWGFIDYRQLSSLKVTAPEPVERLSPGAHRQGVARSIELSACSQ